MGSSGQPPPMTVIDIDCPGCGRSDSVRKAGIGAYRCTACDREFDHEAIDPVEQTGGEDRR